MKALVDENLSPALARSLNALFAGEHEIVHIREKFGPGVKDVAWVGQLSTEGALDRHLWRSTHYPEQGRICCISKLSARRVFSFEGPLQGSGRQANGAATRPLVHDRKAIGNCRGRRDVRTSNKEHAHRATEGVV
ncbi:hypothetical protein NKI64_23225 [Mesorhizobium sp. M0478]|nr:hypothetical protein [Mesorhizobium sp. LSJC255A00]